MNMREKREDRSITLPESEDELKANEAKVNHKTIVEFYGGGNFDSRRWIKKGYAHRDLLSRSKRGPGLGGNLVWRGKSRLVSCQ